MKKTGADLLKRARTRLGSKYVLGALAPKDDENYKGPFDCAEFIAWVVRQETGKLIGCDNSGDAYTGYFARDAENGTLTKISVEEAMRTEGALLLRKPKTSAIGHIAFSDGNYGTVEAHSSKLGTIEGSAKGRSWDYGLLMPFVDHKVLPLREANLPKFVHRLTSPIQTGSDVKAIQAALNRLNRNGHLGAKLVEDGKFGTGTHEVLVQFQKCRGLVPDGQLVKGGETEKELGIKLSK